MEALAYAFLILAVVFFGGRAIEKISRSFFEL